MTPSTFNTAQPSGNSRVKTALIAGGFIALLAANVYLYVQVDRLHAEQAQLRVKILTELTNLREASTVTTASQRRSLEALKGELETARKQTAVAVTQAKTEAVKNTEKVAQQLTAEQRRQQQQVSNQLSEVKEAANTASAKIAEDVSSVRSEVASTKTELEKTISDLKRVTGDLGVQSGLIATNGRELDALKRLGERNYFEFNLGKTKQPQRVGDITLLLKKADPKRNRYTVEVMADDKKTEKKDKNVNEPVQFYTAKARQPYELVVNQVKKDLIVGYLATPKEQAARN